jgi:hypothetical protein
MIRHDRTGGRTVELFIPFDYNGKRIDAITFGAVRFGHVLKWGEGAWQSMIELMTELAGIDEAILRELRYPDADRVLEVFFAMLPPNIRDDIGAGSFPAKAGAAAPHATNGSGAPISDMQAPGVPIPPVMPEAGFDMGEEP